MIVETVVRLGFPRTGFAEDLAPKALGEERFNVGNVLRNDQVEQVGRLSMIRDQVRRPVARAQVEDLNSDMPLARGHFPGALRELLRIVRAGNKDAHRPVEDLVDSVEDQIAIMRLHD
jgi:hypothetical protein